MDGDLDPLIGEWWVSPACAWGTSGACVSSYPAGHIDSRITGKSGTACLRFSTVVRTENGRGEETKLIAQPLLESRTSAYIDWLDDNLIRLIIIIHK